MIRTFRSVRLCGQIGSTWFSTRLPDIAEELRSEMERAKIKPLNRIPARVIRMGSKVTLHSGEGEVKTVTVVYPGKADIAEGKVSILTPVVPL